MRRGKKMEYKPQTTALIEQLQIDNDNNWHDILDKIIDIISPDELSKDDFFYDNEITPPKSEEDYRKMCWDLVDRSWYEIGEYFESLSVPIEFGDFDEDGRRTGL